MSILVVGSVAFDSVKTPHGEVQDALGGSAVYFSCAANNFTRVSLMGVIGEDFPARHIQMLRDKGIDTRFLQQVPGRTFRWKGAYEGDMNVAQTLDVELNVFGEFKPELPAQGVDHHILFLANGHPAMQAHVAGQAADVPLKVLDTMNHWIANEKEALENVLQQINGLILNDAEAIQLTQTHHLIEAGKRILDMGPEFAVIKKGEHGSIIIRDGDIFVLPAFPTTRVKDPTGAGDSFAGGMFGYLAECAPGAISFDTLRTAMVYGTVTASFTVEDFSLDRLETIDREQIDERVAHLKRITRF